MRIDFADKSFISATRSPEGRVVISVGATTLDDPLSLVLNTAELSEEEFKKLISDLE